MKRIILDFAAVKIDSLSQRRTLFDPHYVLQSETFRGISHLSQELK